MKFPLSKLGLYGITTEGANTGKEAGLWKKLSDYLERNIFTVWCMAHRSDLAIEDVMRSVGELTIWKTNLKAVSTYFRTSKNRKKELLKIFPTAREFPRYHDVRFAQHFLNLVDALIFNIDACKQVWQQLEGA